MERFVHFGVGQSGISPQIAQDLPAQMSASSTELRSSTHLFEHTQPAADGKSSVKCTQIQLGTLLA
jgi:hypothetical protein